MATKRELKEALGKRVRLTHHTYGRLNSEVEGVLDSVNAHGSIRLTDVTITKHNIDGESTSKYPGYQTFVGRRRHDTFEVINNEAIEDE